jgi:hypothetical protein
VRIPLAALPATTPSGEAPWPEAAHYLELPERRELGRSDSCHPPVTSPVPHRREQPAGATDPYPIGEWRDAEVNAQSASAAVFAVSRRRCSSPVSGSTPA